MISEKFLFCLFHVFCWLSVYELGFNGISWFSSQRLSCTQWFGQRTVHVLRHMQVLCGSSQRVSAAAVIRYCHSFSFYCFPSAKGPVCVFTHLPLCWRVPMPPHCYSLQAMAKEKRKLQAGKHFLSEFLFIKADELFNSSHSQCTNVICAWRSAWWCRGLAFSSFFPQVWNMLHSFIMALNSLQQCVALWQTGDLSRGNPAFI